MDDDEIEDPLQPLRAALARLQHDLAELKQFAIFSGSVNFFLILHLISKPNTRARDFDSGCPRRLMALCQPNPFHLKLISKKSTSSMI